MGQEQPIRAAAQEDLYRQVSEGFAAALERLLRAYESDPDRRRDLLQEVHLALWRSFAVFDRRCSLRTWVYRVAHNAATSHGIRRWANAPRLLSLDDMDDPADESDVERDTDRRMSME
jgi:RNA polymerase sigma-70 factor (ECF subfamily)